MNWISVQPLTGGMYIGFANALGCDARCIISYPGLDSPGNNEFHLMKWLEKRARIVPRLSFDNIDMSYYGDDPGLVDSDGNKVDVHDISEDIDIVCGVPICSGLSLLASTDKETKALRNCNMKFLAKYVLETIHPKAYVFENAPGFMSDTNSSLRIWFEKLASETGYAISYFKTTTSLHYNCQCRPRTFVVMSRSENGNRAPLLGDWMEDKYVNAEDMFNAIPADATQMDVLPMRLYENVTTIEYAMKKWPDTWRMHFKGDIVNNIMKEGLLDDFYQYCSNRYGETEDNFYLRMVKHIEHIKDSISKGKGWWSSNPKYYDGKYGAVQSRTVFSTIHPIEDRLLSCRELLTLMGMPYDFELQGSFMRTGRQIGQNVPVKTAEWIARQTVKIINSSPIEPSDGCEHNGARYYDNIKKAIVY